jgi:hypothetical protein
MVLGMETDWVVPSKLNEEFCPQSEVEKRKKDKKRKPLRAFIKMIHKDK